MIDFFFLRVKAELVLFSYTWKSSWPALFVASFSPVHIFGNFVHNHCLTITGSFCFHKNFKLILFYLCEEYCWNFLGWHCICNYHFGKTAIFTILIVYPWRWRPFYLLELFSVSIFRFYKLHCIILYSMIFPFLFWE